MAKPEIKMIDGDEQDALTKWSHVCFWQTSERKKIKRRFRKRVRRTTKAMLRLIGIEDADG